VGDPGGVAVIDLSKIERKFLDLITESPGIAASQLPKTKRGATLKTLELASLIQYGPGGWYPVPPPKETP
jgi:hypothetical protein